MMTNQPAAGPCECARWARIFKKPITKHHPRCEHYDPEGDCAELIGNLLRGIEAWANDEDGVHDDCWDAYHAAKQAMMEYDYKEAGRDG